MHPALRRSRAVAVLVVLVGVLPAVVPAPAGAAGSGAEGAGQPLAVIDPVSVP